LKSEFTIPKNASASNKGEVVDSAKEERDLSTSGGVGKDKRVRRGNA